MSSNQVPVAAGDVASNVTATPTPTSNAERQRRSNGADRPGTFVPDKSSSTGGTEALRLSLMRMKQEDSVLSLDEEKRFRDARALGDARATESVLRGAVQRTERDVRALQEATPAEIRTIAKVLDQAWSIKGEQRVREILDSVANRTVNEAGRVSGEGRAAARAAERDDTAALRSWQQRMLEARERLAQQFTVEGKNYLYRGRSAFVDDGQSIRAYDASKRTVQAVLDLAVTKGWNEVQVIGRPEFQRAVWTEAQVRGLKVNSEREPTQADREAVRALAAQRRGPGRTETAELTGDGKARRPAEREPVAGIRREPAATPALATLEKVMRQSGASEPVIDRALRVGAQRESALRSQGQMLEVRGVDPAAARTTTVPNVLIQERAGPTRAR
ncbi:MAG: hypothetical protein H0T67_11245 [Burkholderiaceae bacterium]|nr:hypothetical protein [Burkholderiaceae bacterium]